MKIFDPHITGSLSVSASAEIQGDLIVSGTIYGTAQISGQVQEAVSASHAAEYLLTSSFETYTGSAATTGSNTFIGDQTISGSLLPQGTLTHDLGSDTQRWRDIYLAGNTINLGGTKITKNNDGNVEIKDGSNNLKKIVASEIEIGVGASKKVLKVDNGKFKLMDTADTKDELAALSGSFTGSFEGDGARLTNVPASAVTGLNLARISNTTATASISNAGLITNVSVIPDTTDTIDLGSPTKQWRDLYLSSGSLYINGQQVLSTTGTELRVTTDSGESIKILETGSDTITLQTVDGDITLTASGNGNIELDAPIQVAAGNKILSSDGNSVVFGNGLVITGSIELSGNVDGVDVADLRSDVDAILAGSSADKDSFAEIVTLINSVDTSNDQAFAAHYTASNNRLDSLETISSSHDGRLDSVESFTSSIDTTIKNKLNTETVVSGSEFVLNSTSPITQYVDVTVTQSGGRYYIDGVQTQIISLAKGLIYRFDVSDASNSGHPFRFSTTSDGTHGGGSVYTDGVTVSGTEGNSGAYVQIIVNQDTPQTLHYYCVNHGGMGSKVFVGGAGDTDSITEGSTNLYYTDARVKTKLNTEDVVSGSIQVVLTGTTGYGDLNTRLGSIETFTGSIDNTYATDQDVTDLRGDFNTYTSSTDTNQTTQNNRLDALETKSGSVDTLNTTQNNRLSSLETKTGSLDGDITTLDGRVDSLETESASIRSTLNTYTSSNDNTFNILQLSVAALEVKTGSLDNTDTAYNLRLNSLETTSGSHGDRLGSIETKTGSLENTDTAHNLRLNALESTSGSHDGRLDSLETKTGSLENTDTAHNLRLNAIETFTGSIDNTYATDQDVSDLRGDFNTYTSSTDNSISTIDGRVDSLETTSGSHNTRITNLETFETKVDGGLEFTGSNVTIKGDLLVKGTETRVNSTTVEISDNIISLNGSGAANAGIEVRDATAPGLLSGSFIWDGTNNYWKGGTKGSEERLLLNSDLTTLDGRLDSLETESGSIRSDFNSYTSSNDTTNTTQNSRLTSLESATGSYTTTDYFVTGATFGTSNGVITLTRNDGNTVTVDIDGKYAEASHSHNNIVTVSTQASNYDFNDLYSNNQLRFHSTYASNGSWTGANVTNYPTTPTANAYAYGITISAKNTSQGSLQVYAPHNQNSQSDMFFRTGWGTDYKNWARVWTDRNDGAGSGLDADVLDGQQGTYYLNYNNFTNTPTIGDGTLTVEGSSGLTGSGTFTANQTGDTTITITHADTSSQSSSNNSGRTYIQDILLDTYGHITGLTTATETVTNTDEYTTGGTLNTSSGIITFVRNDGDTYDVDISATLSDVTVTGATYDSSTQTLTMTKSDGNSFNVTGFAVDTDVNWYLTGATFNTGNGVLSLTVKDYPSSPVTVDLDGRYSLTTHNHDGSYIKDGGTTAIGNIDTIGTESIKHRWNASTVGRPASGQSNEYGTVTTLTYDSSRATQIAWDIDQGNLYGRTLDLSTDSGTWVKFWNDTDFSSTNISNWNTAYGWGDHDSVGYITGYTETDTLATVTSRGATTTSDITTGHITTTKENASPNLTFHNGGNDMGTNAMLAEINFTADYQGSSIPYGSIQVHTNASPVRTDIDFIVKSTSGTQETALKLQGGANKPKAFFYNNVDIDGSLIATSIVKDGGTSSQFLMADGSTSTNPGWITGFTNTYVTGATLSSNILTLTRNDATDVTVNLNALVDVTVTGGSYNDSTKTLTLNKSDSNSISITGFTIDTNTLLTGATFNTGNGVITLTKNDGNTVTVDIDGRYAYYAHQTTTNSDFNNVRASGIYTLDYGGQSNANSPDNGAWHALWQARSGGTRQAQITIPYNADNIYYRRGHNSTSEAWYDWVRIWDTGDFSSTQVTNWDAAYTYSQVGHLPLAGGTMSGGINMNNNNLTNVNHIQIGDPGAGEGIEWSSGNGFKIYESPNNLTNASGNLQFVVGSTRILTLGSNGQSEFTDKLTLTSSTSGSTIFDIQGTSGQLFSITDDLTGDLFAVSDASGVPIFNVNASGAITMDTLSSFYVGDNKVINGSGNIVFDGPVTTTNQDRGIYWTAYDKEGTTDLSDTAHIIHTSNDGGLSGSVIQIKSHNDATDGVNFVVNATDSGVRINGNAIATQTWVNTNTLNQTEGDARYLQLAGGTITGNLIVDGILYADRNNGDVSAPSTSDHSLGTRINLYDASTTAFYAIGIESSTMWFNSDDYYKWYVDGSVAFQYDGAFKVGGNTVWDSGDFTSTNISNWNTAYGWGNHASAGYLTSLPSHTHSSLVENATITYGDGKIQWTDQSGTGGTGLNGAAPGNPFSDWFHHIVMNHANSSGYYVDIAACFHSDDVYFRRNVGGSLSTWREFIHSGNIGSQSVNYATSAGSATTADQIDGVAFRNTGSNSGINADSLNSNGVTYYTGGVTNFSGNSTDGALYSQAYSSSWQHQIAGDYRGGRIAVRGKNNNTWQSWKNVALRSSTTFTNATSVTLTHNLGTENLVVQCYDSSGNLFFPRELVVNATEAIAFFTTTRSGRIVAVG